MIEYDSKKQSSLLFKCQVSSAKYFLESFLEPVNVIVNQVLFMELALVN
jgi:hypothetical protein